MSVRPDRQFRFAIAAINAIGLCPPWRAILRHHWSYDWSYNGRLDRTKDIWITNHGYLDFMSSLDHHT